MTQSGPRAPKPCIWNASEGMPAAGFVTGYEESTMETVPDRKFVAYAA